MGFFQEYLFNRMLILTCTAVPGADCTDEFRKLASMTLAVMQREIFRAKTFTGTFIPCVSFGITELLPLKQGKAATGSTPVAAPTYYL